MSTLLSGRTESARGRIGERLIVYHYIERDTKSALMRLLDALNGSPPPRPAGSPSGGAAYFRTLIERNDHHETSIAHWLAGRSCTLHGHSESEVLFRVVSGTVVEERYVPDSNGNYRCEVQTLEKGQQSYLPCGAFHRLHCLTEATTIHAFSPPPSDATSPVPAELVSTLETARRRLLDPVSVAEPVSAAAAVHDESIVESVSQRLDDWARREEEQNQNNEVRVSAETLQELRASGILAATVPRELGGWDSSLAETAQAIRRLAQRAPATALALAMPLGNAATARIPDGAVPEKLHAELAAGRRWIGGA